MFTTTTESISSAVAYGASLKSPVSYAHQVGQAAKIREEIKSGKYPGVSFPDNPKIKEANRLTEKNRQAVSLVHSFRREGHSLAKSCKMAGVAVSTYADWKDRLKMPYSGPILTGTRKGKGRETV
jgi:hypothetical protein